VHLVSDAPRAVFALLPVVRERVVDSKDARNAVALCSIAARPWCVGETDSLRDLPYARTNAELEWVHAGPRIASSEG
jgi:hypothetical protein